MQWWPSSSGNIPASDLCHQHWLIRALFELKI
jgi:hypothetical protein